MPFQIIRNDITKVVADAIVNTANPEPTVGGGTDYAIHQAAGPELLVARKEIGKLSVGQSVATPAFQLSAKYVLHTVSPVWIDGQHQEEELLRKVYDSALYLADELKCKSVAFPLLSAGTYGFPHDRALAVAIQAFTDFLVGHEMQISLVLFNSKAFGMAGSIFDDLKSYIDDNYVNNRNEEECIAHFYILHLANIAFYGGTSVILPLELDVFEKMVELSGKSANTPNPNKVRELCEYSLKVAKSSKDEKDWYEAIKNKALIGWQHDFLCFQ